MKHLKLLIPMLLLGTCWSCEKPDLTPQTPPKVTFGQMSDVQELIAYQSTAFGGNTFPGTQEDYHLFFGQVEIPITKVVADSIHVFVPFEVEQGTQPARLLYKGEEHPLGTVKILDWRTLLPSNVSFVQTGES
jgi:hypothetical protein